ncbi:GLPGLI family protein [Pedobacter hiemivivus]|uniref:GLPGLI family protein n=1 Tax=Pedobacter hiemivivus TaxID=2530454 RepID=A0A4U1G921_9SPHI|nr:GLPGLI family protein [Pedobacter hiemivivus]TKC60365.1 GLPGLI family protein [Pedobacter hiemivivus]
MKTKFILLAGLIFTVHHLFAQNVRFTNSGVIEFEKSINQHATIKKAIARSGGMMGSSFDDFKKSAPQFKLLKSTLRFSGNKTLFAPVVETDDNRGMFGGSPESEQSNITYTDLSTNTFITEKKFFEETFLVKDSPRKINWKLTSEMRDIAGYECRRANAIIMDSVYVVAFYTDKIPVSGGPESFTGLPGMILGVALPHDNITWFAKTVTDRPIPVTEIKPPTKGKPMDNKSLLETISKVLNRWGSEASRMIKLLLI